MHLAQRSGRERLWIELAKDILGKLSHGRFELRARHARVHAGRVHLQGGQFAQRFLRENAALHAQKLAQFHGRALERTQFAAHLFGGVLLKMRPSLRLSRLAQQKILRLVTEVTSDESKSKFPHAKPTTYRAACL